MTKMKSKKMTKSTFAIIIMAVAMVAMLAFGGTYAYFTASAKNGSTGNFETGKVLLTTTSAISAISERVVPKDVIVEGAVSYSNESTVDTYVAVQLIVKVGTSAQEKDMQVVDLEDIDDILSIKLATGAEQAALWQECETSKGVYIYKGNKFAVTEDVDTLNFTSESIVFDVQEHWTNGDQDNNNDGIADENPVSWEGKFISISISAYQVQVGNAYVDASNKLTVSAEDASNAEQVWTAIQYMIGK